MQVAIDVGHVEISLPKSVVNEFCDAIRAAAGSDRSATSSSADTSNGDGHYVSVNSQNQMQLVSVQQQSDSVVFKVKGNSRLALHNNSLVYQIPACHRRLSEQELGLNGDGEVASNEPVQHKTEADSDVDEGPPDLELEEPALSQEPPTVPHVTSSDEPKRKSPRLQDMNANIMDSNEVQVDESSSQAEVNSHVEVKRPEALSMSAPASLWNGERRTLPLNPHVLRQNSFSDPNHLAGLISPTSPNFNAAIAALAAVQYASPVLPTPHAQGVSHIPPSPIQRTCSSKSEEDESKNIICSLCSQTFVSKTNLRHHIFISHMGMKPFKCDLCPKRFTRRNILRDHSLAVHRCLPKTYNRDMRVPPLEELTRRIASKRPLETEEISPSETGPGTEEESSSGASRDDDNDVPQTEESKENLASYVCQVCGISFRAEEDLRAHIFCHHLGSSLYQCRECSEGYSTAAALQDHWNIEHASLGPIPQEPVLLPELQQLYSLCQRQGLSFKYQIPSSPALPVPGPNVSNPSLTELHQASILQAAERLASIRQHYEQLQQKESRKEPEPGSSVETTESERLNDKETMHMNYDPNRENGHHTESPEQVDVLRELPPPVTEALANADPKRALDHLRALTMGFATVPSSNMFPSQPLPSFASLSAFPFPFGAPPSAAAAALSQVPLGHLAAAAAAGQPQPQWPTPAPTAPQPTTPTSAPVTPNGQVPSSGLSPEGDTNTCKYCHKSFMHARNVMIHIKEVHMKVREHQCRQCGQAFSRRNNLRKHVEKLHGISLQGMEERAAGETEAAV